MSLPDLLRGSSADVSVRPAVPGDETALARVQLAAWRAAHAEVLEYLSPDRC